MADDDYKLDIKERIAIDRVIDEVVIRGGFCLICEYSEDPRIIEEHHVAGRHNSNICIPVCPNCHRKLTFMQKSWPKDWNTKNNSQVDKTLFLVTGFMDIAILISERAVREARERKRKREGK